MPNIVEILYSASLRVLEKLTVLSISYVCGTPLALHRGSVRAQVSRGDQKMNRRIHVRALWLVCLSLAASAAHAVVIDFNTQLGASPVNVATYSEDGFIFTSSVSASNALTFWGTSNSGWTGSPALFSNYTFETAKLAATDGLAFTLDSIDVSELFPNQGASALNVVLRGLHADGTTTTTTLAMDGVFGMQTFVLGNAMSNVVSISWQTLTAVAQFDNLVLQRVSVPEPSSLALLGLGMAGLALVRSRRRVR